VRLIAQAPGKVNLCLFIGPRRSDGRHELVTLFESVSLADEVSLTTRDGVGPDEVRCPGVKGHNIVSRALEGLRARGWDGPPVTVEIAKRIPVAAGMGGGSADAAATLRLAEHVRDGEQVRPAELDELAAELGSDVPGQLRPGLALGTGAGDRVEPLPPLAPHAFLIVPLPHRLSTARVYAEADRLGLTRAGAELEQKRAALRALSGGAELPAELVVNDLEPAAISLCPQVTDALAAVRAAGALHAMVSGSGPTVFGLFWGADASARAEDAARTLSGRLQDAKSAVAVDADFSHPRVSAQSAQ
jgi:4-diphosphocytidyl-2-C-methyl-D-erythritol kinase